MTDAPTPLTDATESEFLGGRSLTWIDVAAKSAKVFANMRILERRCAELEAGLRDIEMETREGGQFDFGEINELARALLEKRDG